MEYRTFYDCKKLNYLQLPEGLEVIGKECFVNCSFETIEIPSTVVKIDDSAFLKCKQLRNLIIPQNVRIIEKWAFHGCPKLEKVVLLHDPEVLGEWLFNRNNVRIVCHKGSNVDQYCKDYEYKTEYVENLTNNEKC